MTIIDTKRVRLRYEFNRELTADETELLAKLALWRKDSSFVRDDQGKTTGVICHPDDLSEFRKQLRERDGVRIGVTVAGDVDDGDKVPGKRK